MFLTLEAMGLDYDVNPVRPPVDTMKPEFIRLNPQHNIPVYQEGSFVLNESRWEILNFPHKNRIA